MPQLPWMAINASVGVLVITLLVGHIFYAAISRIAKVENDVREMMKLKTRAEAADVAKSQVSLVLCGIITLMSIIIQSSCEIPHWLERRMKHSL